MIISLYRNILTFDATYGNVAHQSLVAQNEQDQRRQDGKSARRKEDLGVRPVHGVDSELIDADRQRRHCICAGIGKHVRGCVPGGGSGAVSREELDEEWNGVL